MARSIGVRLRTLWLCLAALAIGTAAAPAPTQGPQPIFRADFETSCVSDSTDWKASSLLDKAVRADRLHCIDTPAGGEGRRALRVIVKPGDAYDPNPTSLPTERAEVQLTRELVRFDTTTWYSFIFRVDGPWIAHENRTVIHQIKQNITKGYEIGAGGVESCAPAHPLFKIEVGSNGKVPVFRAKATGTDGCGDGVGQTLVCSDQPLSVGTWHRVHVAIKPSQRAGASYLQVWLDEHPCPTFRGVLGYPRFGVQRDGQAYIDTQPRFGLYRDALPDVTQSIVFDDIAFWDTQPAGHPAWSGIDLSETN